MIRIIIMLSLLSAVFCQYPRRRDSPVQTFTGGSQDYEQPAYEDEDYDYRPQPNNQRSQPNDYRPQPNDQRPQPNDYRPQPNDQKPQSRNSVIYKPASVHYVNIGAELSGDYKFGYDTGKAENGQSFREETRLPDGSVQGAYGYTDETGKQHIVKYTAGKDGYKVLGSGDEKKSSSQQPKRAYSQPQVHQPAQRQPQPAYQAPRAQAAYRPAPEPQRAYVPAPQSAYAPAPQSAYAPAPQSAYEPAPQRTYASQRPSSYAPEPQSSYVPQPQTYAPKPQTYSSRGRSSSRYVPQPGSSYQGAEEDYDYPDNEVTERRLAPIDTSLFNYNIGTSSANGGHA